MFLRELGRNAVSPNQTCWFTVHVRTEQDVPHGRMAVARAINSWRAGMARFVHRAGGGWYVNVPLAVCKGRQSWMAREVCTVPLKQPDALFGMTSRVQYCAFVSASCTVCARDSGHNFHST